MATRVDQDLSYFSNIVKLTDLYNPLFGATSLSLSTPCLKKQSKLFSSELRQISTNCDNFWHKDGKEAKII